MRFDFSRPSRTNSQNVRVFKKARRPRDDLEKYISKLYILLESAQMAIALQDEHQKIEAALVEASHVEKGAPDSVFEEES